MLRSQVLTSVFPRKSLAKNVLKGKVNLTRKWCEELLNKNRETFQNHELLYLSLSVFGDNLFFMINIGLNGYFFAIFWAKFVKKINSKKPYNLGLILSQLIPFTVKWSESLVVVVHKALQFEETVFRTKIE